MAQYNKTEAQTKSEQEIKKREGDGAVQVTESKKKTRARNKNT